MDPSTARFQTKPEVVFTRLDDSQAALLHLDTKRYYSLNETASRLWELLSAPRNPATICRILEEEYETSLSDVKASVMRFLQDLWREGLITASEECFYWRLSKPVIKCALPFTSGC